MKKRRSGPAAADLEKKFQKKLFRIYVRVNSCSNSNNSST